ncbi:YbaK/prolyl-tRNA synthetase associated domain-containing protein [Paraburkholderia sp. B3]|uniref:YbaK/prolyl-tRNA synthetase associated domain-containing protein n=1 Tax=Paraburkholderia sp. B3 TaxID=3134791 RepID=UPI003981AFAD
MSNRPVFERLNDLLVNSGVRFRVLEHPEEGRSDAIALLRGTAPEQGAKAMLCVFKDPEATPVLAVIPGNRKLDFRKLSAIMGRKKATLASPELARALTDCVMGAVPPFVFGDHIELVVDPALIHENSEIAFNAGRLDRSVILNAEDYVRIARPILADIIQSETASAGQ